MNLILPIKKIESVIRAYREAFWAEHHLETLKNYNCSIYKFYDFSKKQYVAGIYDIFLISNPPGFYICRELVKDVQAYDLTEQLALEKLLDNIRMKLF